MRSVGCEVIQSRVRRERLGHINPCDFGRSYLVFEELPSRIGNLLDVTLRDVERVLYCVAYIVTDNGDTPLNIGDILSEDESSTPWINTAMTLSTRAWVQRRLSELLEQLDIPQLAVELRDEMRMATSEAKRKKLSKRLKFVEAFVRVTIVQNG